MPVNDSNNCNEIIFSDDYEDFIIEFNGDISLIEEMYQPSCIQLIGNRFASIYMEKRGTEYINRYGYNSVPKCFGLLDTSTIEETGVNKIRRQPYLDLYGQDILIGFIDTGIDYTHSVFRNADNTSRILSIWDQTINEIPEGSLGQKTEYYDFGTEYTKEMLNAALRSENPFHVVPTTDENGHGTFIAGIAAGNEDLENDFSGIAPLSNIVAVKLKQAKPYLRKYYGIEADVPCFQENDIMMAIRYLVRISTQYGKPLVICIGIGSNAGSHSGDLFLSDYLNITSQYTGIATVTAAGNEVNLGHHYQGELQEGVTDEVELKISEKEQRLYMEIWAKSPNEVALDVVTPLGETANSISIINNREQRVTFIFEKTILYFFKMIDIYTGNEVIILRFENPTPGIWTIKVHPRIIFSGTYHIWMPMEHFVEKDTYFLVPDPNITICEPGNAEIVMTMSTYNHKTQAIYLQSSRGFTWNGNIKPDLAAPGVTVYGPVPGNKFSTKTGSSIAAAQGAGLSALMMQWGITEQHNLDMNTVKIKNYFIRGAKRTDIIYPNNEWGYGQIDIYEAFRMIR